MDIGTIKTITLEDGRLECVVDFGSDDVDPLVVIYNGANRAEYPLPGDEVVVDRDGAESVIVAVFREHPDGVGSGESIIYGRDGDGNMVSSVKVCSDGNVKINDGTAGDLAIGTASDYVAMAKKVDDLWYALYKLFVTDWVVIPTDGGAALKAAFSISFPPPGPGSVASTNIKGD